ncbi:MAG: DUF1638 domain-containing protein [Candidatus Bathyarchaeota archaeon]|nr:DUF1638 domain-containing protein [Candidatus Bathyarchaeota archaeon]
MKVNKLGSAPKTCLVACSVLKQELQQLIKEGKLNADLVLVSKNFHIDYALLESNLRKMLQHTKQRYGKIVLVYGDLCLGPDGEMKKLADEFSVVKVDALNCIDCQLGGGGKSAEADPEHNLMFMGPGMIEFFAVMKANLKQQGMDEAAFSAMYSGIKGMVLLDTCGDAERHRKELERLGIGLEVLEVRKVGLDNVCKVVLDAISRA